MVTKNSGKLSMSLGVRLFVIGFILVASSTASSYLVDTYTWWMLVLFVSSVPFLLIGGMIMQKRFFEWMAGEGER